MKHIVLAVPAYTGTVHLGTMRSILADVIALTSRGDKVTIDDECGSTDLPDARAAMVAKFLAGSGTHLVNIDNDICWEAGALVRLVDHPVDCVGAVYPKREDPISYPVRYLQQHADIPYDTDTGLIELEAIQGGFVRYSRACLEMMVAAYQELAFRTSRYPDLDLPGLWREVMADERTKLGEDFAFFHRWRAIGGKVWCDPDVTMAHVGLKAFIGNLGQWLKSQMEQAA